MAITPIYINIGYVNDDPRVVTKTFHSLADSVPIEATSILDQLNPVFIVNYNSQYLTANYVECSALGRKYFCKVSVNTAARTVLTCSVDPLSSFDLSNCSIAVLRNEGIGQPTMYQDSKLPVYPSKKNVTSIVMQETSGLFTANGDECYVLTVIGGDTSL